MAKYGLNLKGENNTDKKRRYKFAVLFVCFAVVLGAVSFLLLWRSLNYDFNNFFVKSDESTSPVTTTEKTENESYTGKALFLAAVTSDDGTKTDFITLINVDLSGKTIKIIPIDGETEDTETKLSCSQILEKKGIKELVLFLNDNLGVDIDRYVLLTESGYKSVFRTLGNITVKLSESVEYDTADMFLELKKGENILTPEKTYKYMKYICETADSYECSRLNSEIVSSAFSAFFTNDKIVLGDNLFSELINYCKTDISIVDYTSVKDKIEYLAPVSSKEQLKVYVSSKELSDE